MVRIYLIVLFLFLFIVVKPLPAFAQSSYVLPYPAAMPGNVMYKLDLIKEKFAKFLSFGDFGQFNFNLNQSDKYLVEAKTLFEYKQYLLGYNALLKSDEYFKKIKPALISANKNRKDISEKIKVLNKASLKHVEVLQKLKNELPDDYTWTPEKDKPTYLNFGKAIDNSIIIRNSSM